MEAAGWQACLCMALSMEQLDPVSEHCQQGLAVMLQLAFTVIQ